MKPLYCSIGKLLSYTFYIVLFYFVLIAWRPAAAQSTYRIDGQVLAGADQTPLTGANVQIRRQNLGTSTDKNGNFQLTSLDVKVELIISFIGYRSVDTLLHLPLTAPLKISLAAQDAVLDEVKVSTGYWESTRQLSTGSIGKISSQTISQQPVTNVMNALSGRIAGVFVQQTSGLAGAPVNISIRGRNSIRTDGNNPLYVIDGVPFTASIATALGGDLYSGNISPMNSINPADIESIEILKDADATAIYGTRGANGVILITTKRATQSKTKLDVSFSQGAGQVASKMKLLSTAQYIQMRRQAFLNDGVEPTASNAPDLLNWDTERYTDWQKVLVGGTARSTTAQAVVSGGDANTHYALSGTFYKETTVFPGDFAFLRGSGHLSVTHSSSDQRFKLALSVSYIADKNNLMRQNLASQALTIAPNAPDLYLASGELNWAGSTWQNPMSYLRQTYKAVNENLVSTTSLSYRVLPGLLVKANLGYTTINTNQMTTSPVSYFNPAYGVTSGESSFANAVVKTWIAEPQIQYDRAGRFGALSFLSGMSFQQNRLKDQTLSGSGYSSDVMLENIQSAATVSVLTANQSMYRYTGLYGRLNYSYQDRYILNLTARRDGSSRFGPNKQFANFGAVGGAWLFYKEAFFKQGSILSFGKIKASYGTSGSDQIPDYGYLDTYAATSYTYNGHKGLYATKLVNTDYSWEKSRKFDLGLETGFFNDRIYLTIDWFENTSSNQLVGYPLSSVTGQSQIQYNLGAKVRNSGWELGIENKYITRPDFQWSGSLNLTVPKNKLVAYPGLQGSSYVNTYVIGQPLSIRKTYNDLGVDPSTGVYRMEDVDGNGLLNVSDRTGVTFVGQRYFGGVQNTLRYRGFSLDIFVQFVKQTGANYKRDVFSMPGAWGFNTGNQPTWVLQAWQKTGDNTTEQKFSQSYASSNAVYKQFSEARSYGANSYGDASYIRLKNVALSWQMPIKNTHKLAGPRIFLQAQNLATITAYKGWDPEQASVSYLPPLRMITAGVSQQF